MSLARGTKAESVSAHANLPKIPKKKKRMILKHKKNSCFPLEAPNPLDGLRLETEMKEELNHHHLLRLRIERLKLERKQTWGKERVERV